MQWNNFSPKHFSSHDNSGGAQPAEVPGTASISQVQSSHPLVPSVADVPNFDANSFDSANFEFTAEQLNCPLVLEIFCGSGRVTASLKSLGMSGSFGIDHKVKNSTTTVKELDLTLPEHQRILFTWLRSPLVVGIFLAPPCGTCSLARSIKLRDPFGRPMNGPRPLRSPESPEGLQHLTQTERLRVSLANKLYELVAKVVKFVCEKRLLVVVENPRSSLFWLTKFWQSVSHLMRYTAHQACAYGGMRAKWTVLAWNHDAFSNICRTCPGESPQHQHKPWGLVHTSEGHHFSTSEETAYPKPLAHAIALTFAQILIHHGWVPPQEQLHDLVEPNLKVMRAIATAQPKAAQIPPIVREHKAVVVIQGPFELLATTPVQPMQRLSNSWEVPSACNSTVKALPPGTQLLRTTPLRSKGGILQQHPQQNPDAAEQAWGIPFNPDEFMHEAVKNGHPKSFAKLVPSILLEAVKRNCCQNPSASDLARERTSWFIRWTKRAGELATEERALKACLEDHVRRILEPKRLLLWKEILVELEYPDCEVFEFLEGTHLVGEVPVCGVFEKRFKPAELTVQQLSAKSGAEKRKNFHRCCSSGDPEVDVTVYEKTLEEVHLGWARGPISFEDLPETAILSRRFGLRQPGKVRLIDDLSGSSVNSTVQTAESPKPQNVDYIGATLLQFLQLLSGQGIVGRTYDLKSAYKQLAVAPSSLEFAYVVVFNPNTRKPEVFQLLAAPFGATRSVYSFLRIIHSVWYIGVVALHLPWSHFFDDFVVFCKSGLAVNTGQTVEMLFRLLGWKYAVEGDKATAFSTSFTALGVDINLSGAARGSVEFANTAKRKAELSSTISGLLSKGTMSVNEAQKLRGRMQFMDGQLFGRLGRLCMKAVTDHAFLKKGDKLEAGTVDSLRRFQIFLEHAAPRALHVHSGEPWFIYTDACYEPGSNDWPCGLGGVLVDPAGRMVAFFSVCLSDGHMALLGAKTKRTIIFEAELLALILAFATWKVELVAASLICFVDNNSARDVAISGSGRNVVARSLIDFLLKLEMAVCAAPWYARVPTPSNVADGPSRGESDLLIQRGVRLSHVQVELDQIMEVLREATVKEGMV